MKPPTAQERSFTSIAPVALDVLEADAVAHSLAVLSTVYHYNHWIFTSFRDYLGERTLEVGSGIGNITQFLLNLDEVVCLEPFDAYRDYLAERFACHRNVVVLPHTIEACPNESVPAGTFDSVVCLNVLEHLEEDVEALRRMKRALKPGGRAIILAPALSWLYGELDKEMGHVRRYTRSSLCRALSQAGLKPRMARYMNLPGVLGWWWHGRVRKRKRIPASLTRKFDRIVPIVSALERLLPLPLGQSIITIGLA